MLITELSIKRPAFSWVLSLILVLFGSFVFWKLPVRELPSGLQPPVVQVNVEYSSASSQIVDEEVTQVLEEVIGGAEGIKNIDSSSENGKSKINIEFDTDVDLDDAANDIRERVARVVERLPSESDPPRILKQAAGFTTTMWLSLSSPTWSDLELGDYVERYLIDQFSSIKNVGRIRTGGLRELSVRVWIDPIKLAASSKSISVSNSMFILLFPFSDDESIFFIPSAPPITSSRTWVTSSSTICEDAEEYSTFTWTTGGCNPDGNSLTGNFQKTNDPNNTNIKDNTHENAGRLILNSVINII